LKKNTLFAAILILSVLVIDQAIKIWVKTNMCMGEEILPLGVTWARLHFTENEGMAFGMTLGGAWGKLALSTFRILAVGFMFYYLNNLLKSRAHWGLIGSIGLVIAGAIGNIIDSAFYGLIFSESGYHCDAPASFVPFGTGYNSFLHGKVVDMFYFPLYEGVLPSWIPIWGDSYMLFFQSVFNFADAAISLGVFFIILFQRRFFRQEDSNSSL
jgi:signal peptidase II